MLLSAASLWCLLPPTSPSIISPLTPSHGPLELDFEFRLGLLLKSDSFHHGGRTATSMLGIYCLEGRVENPLP